MKQLNIKIDDYTNECIELLLYYYEKELGQNLGYKDLIQLLLKNAVNVFYNEEDETLDEYMEELHLTKLSRTLEMKKKIENKQTFVK